MSTGRRGARWIAAILGIALVGSAIVVYLLIRVTAPTPGGDQGLTAVTSELSGPSATADPESSTPTEAPPRSGVTGTASPASSTPTGGSATADSTTQDVAPTPFTSAPDASATSGPSAGDTHSGSTGAPVVSSVLPGSSVPLPASWSGTAQVNIAVVGDCPQTTPTHYTAPADIALDVAGGGAPQTLSSATVGVTDTDPTLTIGVNASAVPTVAVYSATVDNSGTFHRFWDLSLTSSGTRTEISGTVVDDRVLAGSNPNLLVDALPSPTGCPSAPVTGLPRVLAVGSTLSGWVDADSAHFTLQAVTTDGRRALTVTVTASRRQ